MNLTRAELLDTASIKLVEVVLLLMEEGESIWLAKQGNWRSRWRPVRVDFSSCDLHFALSGGAGTKVARYVDQNAPRAATFRSAAALANRRTRRTAA